MKIIRSFLCFICGTTSPSTFSLSNKASRFPVLVIPATVNVRKLFTKNTHVSDEFPGRHGKAGTGLDVATDYNAEILVYG
jgi:hypothetical protein